MKALIKSFVETYGPAGSEEQIRSLIEAEISGHVDEVRTDALGNLIAVKKGDGSGLKVMLAAHMDEIGLIVTHIDDKGFLRFNSVGGVSPHVLLGQRVIFGNGVVGAVGAEKLDHIKDLRLDKMYIDIGADSKGEAEERVRVGHTCAIHRFMDDLGNRVVSKAMDDRIACAVLVEALRRVDGTPHDVYFVFTVQEEVGLRGARTAAYSIDPDLGIAIDVTRTGDTPESITMDVRLGGGAAIKVKDSSMITHPKVKGLLADTAEAGGIPYQFEVLEHGGTDAGAIHLSRQGVPSGTISIPCRYIHTPTEMVDMGDVKACVDLVVAVLSEPIDI